LISWYGLLCERPSSQTEDHFYNQREYCESVASAREGTDVLRIWRGTSSKDICSMAFLMDLVRGKDLTVIDMELDSRFRFTDLVSAPQEVIYGAFGGAGLLDEGKRRKYEDLWKELSAQNAPIRTLGAEGNVIGADDGYFDYEILLKIPPGGALFSETVHDLIEDRRLDDMGRLFWTRRLRSLVSNGVLEASDTDADKSRFPFECMLTKR
ncbi:MAG: hypothetical protein J5822_04255, partial [Eubacteriaceae bacterium]|nr:hypothetical protein [Eubacteriaceae bacterium]